MIEKHGQEIVNHSEYRLGDGLPYGKAFEAEELGFRMKIHLYYDPEKALQESTALYELLKAQENDLQCMEEAPERKLHYEKYFIINRSNDGKMGFVRNHRAIDAALRACGFFLIAETDFKKTTAEILDIYRRRDIVEKSFDALKNELDMKRLRSHTSGTTQGKLFVSFLALIVRSYMLNALRSYMREKGFTLRKILLELDKLKIVQFPGRNEPRLLNPPSKKQREIYAALRIVMPHCIG